MSMTPFHIYHTDTLTHPFTHIAHAHTCERTHSIIRLFGSRCANIHIMEPYISTFSSRITQIRIHLHVHTLGIPSINTNTRITNQACTCRQAALSNKHKCLSFGFEADTCSGNSRINCLLYHDSNNFLMAILYYRKMLLGWKTTTPQWHAFGMCSCTRCR